ncbi:hypothetical protein ACIRLA_46400 [Streptomyces sp. NPDC102364]|uniref:hypothetical protein n=1 Tax=Streptomyces sp. NPDC102364 TaxID=3366161 RepID=UPI003819D90E
MAGVEAVSNARALAAARAHGLPVTCEPCDGVAKGLDDPPYTGSPSLDQAPWYDKSRPVSARFLGVMGMKADGFTTQPVERTATALIGDGSALGPLRRAGRDLVYEVVLLALDDEALSYGFEWLAMALRADGCGSSCGGADLCVMAACPATYQDGNLKLRHLYNAGLTDGLKESARGYLSGGGRCDDAGCGGCCDDEDLSPVYAEATFTLTAGTPYIYREPYAVNDGVWTDLKPGDLLSKYDPEAIDDDCPEGIACVTDPDCKAPALPPRVTIPRNPCWPTKAFSARRAWLTVSPERLPLWSEFVPVIEVYTGTKALRRLIVRFYPNPAGLDCARAGADPCAACTSVNVAYLPARSTFTLDGRTRTADVDCSTATQAGAGAPDLYGPGGAAFAWPVFECPTGFCIEVIADDATVTDTTQARVFLVPRGDAG